MLHEIERGLTGTVADWKASPKNFRELVEAHQARVYSIVYRILQNAESAEETAQDVFLALYRNLERIESEDHLRAWLRRVAVQRATDACRRRASRPDVFGEEFREEEGAGTLSNGDAARSAREFRRAAHVERLLTVLSPEQRAIVLLRYQEDMTPTEIAATIPMPLATVKSHLRRGLQRLREEAGRQEKEVLHG